MKSGGAPGSRPGPAGPSCVTCRAPALLPARYGVAVGVDAPGELRPRQTGFLPEPLKPLREVGGEAVGLTCVVCPLSRHGLTLPRDQGIPLWEPSRTLGRDDTGRASARPEPDARAHIDPYSRRGEQRARTPRCPRMAVRQRSRIFAENAPGPRGGPTRALRNRPVRLRLMAISQPKLVEVIVFNQTQSRWDASTQPVPRQVHNPLTREGLKLRRYLAAQPVFLKVQCLQNPEVTLPYRRNVSTANRTKAGTVISETGLTPTLQ